MITTEESREIRQYLAKKHLPIDIIMEVEDHFKTQIETIQTTENCDFETAFYKTKILWLKDFQPVRKSFFSFRKVPRIVRDIQMTEMKNLVKKAFLISLLFSVFSFVFAHLVTKLNYNHYLFITNSAVSIPIFLFVVYYLFSSLKKPLVRAEMYYYNQLLLFFIASCLILFVKNYLKIPDISVYNIYNNSLSEVNYLNIFYNIFEDIATNTIGIYILLFLVSRFRSMRNTKNFNLVNE